LSVEHPAQPAIVELQVFKVQVPFESVYPSSHTAHVDPLAVVHAVHPVIDWLQVFAVQLPDDNV
jgi:hypothetical protein